MRVDSVSFFSIISGAKPDVTKKPIDFTLNRYVAADFVVYWMELIRVMTAA